MNSEETVTLFRQLGRMEEKLDTHTHMLRSYGWRINSVERKLWIQTGIFATIAALVVPKLKALLGF